MATSLIISYVLNTLEFISILRPLGNEREPTWHVGKESAKEKGKVKSLRLAAPTSLGLFIPPNPFQFFLFYFYSVTLKLVESRTLDVF